MKSVPLAAICFIAFASILPAQEHQHDHTKTGAHASGRLGTVAFANSGAPAAQPSFLRGLALLHSFEYEDAADEFRNAQHADATFALAYWAEALTYAKLLWGLDDPAAARAALARLATTPQARLQLAKTERERAYGAAVEALFADADLAMRVRGYADSLHALSSRYPDDLDAAAFASIALQMALANDAIGRERRQAVREEAVTLAERVFTAQPDHPGGAHYLIHATDNPSVAKRGLAAARAYAAIAPDAEHALHMPSHIFLQVGLWDEVAQSNERAWAASRAWVASRNRSAIDLDFHAFAWLHYAYLQQGRYAAARALIDTVRSVLAGSDLTSADATDARHVMRTLQFRLALETGDWSGWEPGTKPRIASDSASDRARFFAAIADYQTAFAAARRGDTAVVRVLTPAFTHDALIKAQLAALVARSRGDHEQSRALLREAALLEADGSYSGPPNRVPSHELLGAALLEAADPAAAVAAYKKSLELYPNRSAALAGLARAYAAAGDREQAAATYRRLLANLHSADSGSPLLEEARRASR